MRNDIFRHIDCPVCGGNRFRIKAELPPKTFLSEERKCYYNLGALGITPDTNITISECRECGFVFVNPRFRADLYDVVYNAAKSGQYQQKKWAYEEGDLKYLYDTHHKWGAACVLLSAIAHCHKRFAVARNDAQTRIRLLDYGCGNGHLLDLARVFGIDAFGVDLDLIRIEHCRSKGHRVCTPEALSSSEKFDVVVSSSVVEHVDDLNAYFRYVTDRIKPNGVFSLNGLTPRIIDLERKSGRYQYVMPLEHINFFTRSSFLRLAGRYGFSPAPRRGVFVVEKPKHYLYALLKNVIFRGFYPNGAFEMDLLHTGC